MIFVSSGTWWLKSKAFPCINPKQHKKKGPKPCKFALIRKFLQIFANIFKFCKKIAKKNSLWTFPCKPFRECRDSFHLPLQIQKNCRNFLKIAERGVKLRKNMEDWRNWVNCENQKINTKKGSACFPPTKSRKGISKCQVPCIFSYFVLSLLFWPKNAYFEYFPLIKLFWSFCRIFHCIFPHFWGSSTSMNLLHTS